MQGGLEYEQARIRKTSDSKLLHSICEGRVFGKKSKPFLIANNVGSFGKRGRKPGRR